MALGKMGARGGFGSGGALQGALNPAAFADGQAAPSGFHWEFVTDDFDSSTITDDFTGQPVVDLVAN